MLILSAVREGFSLFFSGSILLFKLRPVRMISSDVNVKKVQHKVLKTRRKPTLNMGEFILTQLMAASVHLQYTPL